MRLIPGATLALSIAASFFGFLVPSALAGTVNIGSPRNGATVAGSVPIVASAIENAAFHLEVWDNGRKLGNFFSSSMSAATAMPQGRHTLTVLAVSPMGQVLDRNSIVYMVSAQKSTSAPPASTGTAPSTPSVTSVAPTAPATQAAPGSVAIASPSSGSTSISAVRIAASANENTPVQLEIWDNGYKLGQIAGSSVNGVYVLPNGSHVLTVTAVDANGSTLSSSSVNYTVAEDCSQAGNAPCDLDQIGIDNSQNQCNPRIESMWVGNPCGGGVQGQGGSVPRSTLIEAIQENGGLANQGNRTLNGRSAHFQEVQGGSWSNVLFRGTTPAPLPASAIDSHWSLDEYVYLPDPTAHQAFELDAQYSAGGIWSKFYTECAFNLSNGSGYWAVFDSETGGWIFLNGKNQNGQTPPVVPCSRSQFEQPWTGSSNPSFTGWHHVGWTFLRDPDGTVTFQTLTFDGTTTQVNFKPNSASGGRVGDNGNYSALVQLDGMYNGNGQHSVVDAYVSEMHLTHTP
ncbi:MAG: hypothetical protein HIU91_11415 [Acidobacteria bacterium]|nr:hypothetical protein [Acidobacteriota bacterium]